MRDRRAVPAARRQWPIVALAREGIKDPHADLGGQFVYGFLEGRGHAVMAGARRRREDQNAPRARLHTSANILVRLHRAISPSVSLMCRYPSSSHATLTSSTPPW